MTKIRFYWSDDPDMNSLWDEGESTLTPKQGDRIILNTENFIVAKTIIDFDNDVLVVFIQLISKY